MATGVGGVVWCGTVDPGAKVARVLPIPDSDDAIVLLDCEQRPDGVEKWHPFRNLIRIGPNGKIQWRAQLVPDSTWKCYLDVDWRGDELRGFSDSYESVIDRGTGRLVATTFTK